MQTIITNDMIKTFSKIVRRVSRENAPIWRSYVTLKNFDTYCSDSLQWNPPNHETIMIRWSSNPTEFVKCNE